jgi:hypothetical protein
LDRAEGQPSFGGNSINWSSSRAVRCRLDPIVLEPFGDGAGRYPVSQVLEFSLDAAARVLSGHPYDQGNSPFHEPWAIVLETATAGTKNTIPILGACCFICVDLPEKLVLINYQDFFLFFWLRLLEIGKARGGLSRTACVCEMGYPVSSFWTAEFWG